MINLNKHKDLGTLTFEQVDDNWDDIEDAFATTGADIHQGDSDAKAVTPASVGDALDWVTLTDATNIAVNGNLFAAGVVTLAGNRTLQNPTNFSRGTKYIIVRGNSGTERTLTFGSNYKGDLPTLTDISNTRWYLLSLVAFASDHIIVSSVRAL